VDDRELRHRLAVRKHVRAGDHHECLNTAFRHFGKRGPEVVDASHLQVENLDAE
jgi:hypothetical protein